MSIKYVVNGHEVDRNQLPKKTGFLNCAFNTANTYRDHDPLLSDGLGCMKSQVGELREVIRKHNIMGVKVRDSGKLEITSRQGRREIGRVRGLTDADGGYGD